MTSNTTHKANFTIIPRNSSHFDLGEERYFTSYAFWYYLSESGAHLILVLKRDDTFQSRWMICF